MHVPAESMVIIWINLTFAVFLKFQIKKVFNDDYAWVSITWCYEHVTIWVMNFPLVDCYVAFLLYWQLMVSKCKWDGSCDCGIYEISPSFLCMLDQVFNCIPHWYLLPLLTSILQTILAKKCIVSTVNVFFFTISVTPPWELKQWSIMPLTGCLWLEGQWGLLALSLFHIGYCKLLPDCHIN